MVKSPMSIFEPLTINHPVMMPTMTVDDSIITQAENLIHTDIRQAVFALSDALDLVGIDDVAHGKRVGVMAAECAKSAGYNQKDSAFLFALGMVHDIGVSSTTDHRHLVSEFEWENSETHCQSGHQLLKDYPPLAAMAEPILHHHRRWSDPAAQAVPPAIMEQANLIFLVDRVDALAAPHYADRSLLIHTQRIREQIAARSGIFFAPHLVEIFLEASAREAFWLHLESRGVEGYAARMLAQGELTEMTLAEVKGLATIFARIVDAKSSFTAVHSLGVAGLARWLAMRSGLASGRCDKIEIAALLHDLGKLRIPDAILNKAGPLDLIERQIINTHSFETYLILQRIPGFEDIARWAAYHHEMPNGEGYPFHLKGADLPLEARIIGTADVVQAMIQHRPYRPGYSAAQLEPFLTDLAREGQLDGDLVGLVLADFSEALHAARISSTA